MTRAICIAFWPLAAIGAVGAAFVLGYLAWAAIVLWTIVVSPCVLIQRRRSSRPWPTVLMVQFWLVTIGLNVLGGVLPIFLSAFTFPPAFGNVVGSAFIALVWSGVAASLVLLGWVTATAVRSAIHQPSAA